MIDREFSNKCGHCRERAVALTAVDYQLYLELDGRTLRVEVPQLIVPKCARCGTVALDDEANRAITEATRTSAGLLAPREIHSEREGLSLSATELADHLGVPAAFVERWERGTQLQSRAVDKLMRLYFGLPAVRTYVADDALLRSLAHAPSAANAP